MEYRFFKLHGTGNDFIFFDDLFHNIDFTKDQIQWLCDRHFGIGADGIILVRPTKKPDCVAFMHYINADGSLAEMCGNGVRCFAKYLMDRGLVPDDQDVFCVDTLAGTKMIALVRDDDDRVVAATVDMGLPQLAPSSIPTTLEARAQTSEGTLFVGNEPLESPWGSFTFNCVSIGNPHAICFLDNLEQLPNELFTSPEKTLASLNLNLIGSYFCNNEVFPEQANIEFAIIGEERIDMRVYERGVGETLACGTGACATAYAAYLIGRGNLETDVNVPGGTLHIKINKKKHTIMTGPATEVFSGIIDINE
ncbi:MAG: diaminopimelate epimerase [Raoultibacter sp.]|jgi:diaminopimelate epimerase